MVLLSLLLFAGYTTSQPRDQFRSPPVRERNVQSSSSSDSEESSSESESDGFSIGSDTGSETENGSPKGKLEKLDFNSQWQLGKLATGDICGYTRKGVQYPLPNHKSAVQPMSQQTDWNLGELRPNLKAPNNGYKRKGDQYPLPKHKTPATSQEEYSTISTPSCTMSVQTDRSCLTRAEKRWITSLNAEESTSPHISESPTTPEQPPAGIKVDLNFISEESIGEYRKNKVSKSEHTHSEAYTRTPGVPVKSVTKEFNGSRIKKFLRDKGFIYL